MVLGMLVSPISGLASHHPAALDAETARHAELAAQIEPHDHVHDDGTEEERSPGHAHHDPADHTHEKASMLPGLAPLIPMISKTWLAYAPRFGDLDTRSRLDRPPRPIVFS